MQQQRPTQIQIIGRFNYYRIQEQDKVVYQFGSKEIIQQLVQELNNQRSNLLIIFAVFIFLFLPASIIVFVVLGITGKIQYFWIPVIFIFVFVSFCIYYFSYSAKKQKKIKRICIDYKNQLSWYYVLVPEIVGYKTSTSRSFPIYNYSKLILTPNYQAGNIEIYEINYQSSLGQLDNLVTHNSNVVQQQNVQEIQNLNYQQQNQDNINIQQQNDNNFTIPIHQIKLRQLSEISERQFKKHKKDSDEKTLQLKKFSIYSSFKTNYLILYIFV